LWSFQIMTWKLNATQMHNNWISCSIYNEDFTTRASWCNDYCAMLLKFSTNTQHTHEIWKHYIMSKKNLSKILQLESL
jgi:hypothetical protein